MNPSYILCSVSEDLYDIDKANLRMNNIMVTDNLNNALEPILENEASCLFLTDKVIDEQSSMPDIVNKINILYEVYPREIRIIYMKLGGDSDALVRLMDKNSNWDVYYNKELSKLNTEEIIDIFNERKIPMSNRKVDNDETVRSKIITRANDLVDELQNTLTEYKDFEKNNAFKSIVMKNMRLVCDLVIAYQYLKQEIAESNKESRLDKIEIEKLSENLKEVKQQNYSLTKGLKELEENRTEMFNSLVQVQSMYNSLVDSLKDIVNINDINSLLAKSVDADRYLGRAPLIIYFKEYTPVSYFTTFLKHFSSLLSQSVALSKVVVIENDNNTTRIPLYLEKDYVYLTDGTEMERMVLGNLVTCGNNLKLINYLIQNSLKLDILLLYDRTGVNYDLVVGQNVIKFHLLKNMQDKDILGIDSNNIISNEPNEHFFLGKINEYKEIEGNPDLEMSIIASLDLTKKLTSYILNWNEVTVSEIEETGGELIES